MLGLRLDRTSTLSLPRQLTREIRDRLLTGRLHRGEALPPSRLLASELGVARNVIVQAYEQLVAEGYLTSHTGSGTFVADLEIPHPGVPATHAAAPAKPAASRGHAAISFNPGLPDLNRFPFEHWAKTLKEVCLEARAGAVGYGPVQGALPLREALAGYLWRSKGIECGPEQLVIVSGAAQGVDLLARLWRGGGFAAIEDPGYDHVRQIFEQNGFALSPIAADGQGLRTEALPERGKCTCIYVVPSHQFPLGGILPIQRRLALLEYARRKGAWIIEDDYDSEFRYRGEPIQALRQLAPDLVVYLGTFSKVFAPGLRLAFLIVPDHLRTRLCRLKEDLNLRTPPVEQLALGRFLEDRSFDRHVFKMKRVYQRKRRCLIEALSREFGGRVRIAGEDAGLHLLVSFPGHRFRRTDFPRLAERGVKVDWVEDYARRKGRHRHQLVLGYGGLELDQIDAGVRRLRAAMDNLSPE
jgi:GntR family transcriptional regulator/MocR family aminotransferase